MDFVANVGRRHRVEVNAAGTWVDLGDKSLNGYERNVLWRQRRAAPVGGGETHLPVFDDVAWIEGANSITDGRATAAFDVDGDSDLDVVVQNVQGEPHLLINHGSRSAHPQSQTANPQTANPQTTNPGHSLTLRLAGALGNRDGIGARVVIETPDGHTQQREVTSFAGYLAGQSGLLHFGLGKHDHVRRLTVFWPDGTVTQRGEIQNTTGRGALRISKSNQAHPPRR